MPICILDTYCLVRHESYKCLHAIVNDILVQLEDSYTKVPRIGAVTSSTRMLCKAQRYNLFRNCLLFTRRTPLIHYIKVCCRKRGKLTSFPWSCPDMIARIRAWPAGLLRSAFRNGRSCPVYVTVERGFATYLTSSS